MVASVSALLGHKMIVMIYRAYTSLTRPGQKVSPPEGRFFQRKVQVPSKAFIRWTQDDGNDLRRSHLGDKT